jgi:hypothetical protein
MGEEALLLSPEDEVFKEKCNCAMKVQPQCFMKHRGCTFMGCTGRFTGGSVRGLLIRTGVARYLRSRAFHDQQRPHFLFS